MRTILGAILLCTAASCGKADKGGEPAPARGTADAAAIAKATVDAAGAAPAADAARPANADEIDAWLPAVADAAKLAPADLRMPLVAVVVSEAGGINVIEPPSSWSAITPAVAGGGTPVMTIELLQHAVLDKADEVARLYNDQVAIQAIGDHLEALGPAEEPGEWGTIGVGGGGFGDPDELEVEVTYADRIEGRPSPMTPLILAHRQAPATALVQVVARTGGIIAVSHGGAVRALRVGFPWVEVEYGGATDPEDDSEAIDVRIGEPVPTVDPAASYDLMIRQGVNVFDLVHTLQLLDGARALGVAIDPFKPAPPPSQGSGLRMGEVTVDGDYQQAIARRYVRRNFAKLKYCYEKELVARGAAPALRGTVAVSFSIDGNGGVVEAEASGFDTVIDECIAGVIDQIELPKPARPPIAVRFPLHYEPPGG
jgi:hypothetical protein